MRMHSNRVLPFEPNPKPQPGKWGSGVLKFLLLLVFLAAWISPTGALAQGEISDVTDDDVNRVAKQLYCPVCENIPLDVCPTQACEQWRQQIRDMLEEGKSEKEIKDYFVAQYGDRVLGVPPARGANLLVYLVPPALILGGMAILVMALRAWRKAPPELSQAGPGLEGDEYVQRLEEELRKR